MIQHAHILNDQQHCENFCWSEPEQAPHSEPETVNEGLDIHDAAPYPSLHDEDGVCYKSMGNFNEDELPSMKLKLQTFMYGSGQKLT